MHAIAAAIYNDNGFGWSKYMCEEAADAVIEELGLRQQVAGPDGIAYGKHRFVTDWIANE